MRLGSDNDDSRLIGRDPELAQLTDALDQTSGGTSTSLAIRGGAGMGKSALLDAAVSMAPDFTVLRAAGAQNELDPPFAALGDLFAAELRDLTDSDRPGRSPMLAAALGLGDAPTADRYGVAAGALDLVIALSERSPLLIVIDDADWIDSPSASVLAFVSRRLASDRVALLVTLRARRPDPTPFDHFPAIDLSPLTPTAAAALFDRELAGVAPGPDRDDTLRFAAGNPLAISHLARAQDPANATEVQNSVPERLEMEFQRDFSKLDEPTRRAAIISVLGNAESFHILEAAVSAAGITPGALQRCITLELLEPAGGRLRFRHPLMRLVILAQITPRDRAEAHLALERANAEQGLESRSAWHAAAASPAPNEALAARLERAAKDVTSGRLTAPADLYRRAAALSETPGDAGRRWLMAARESVVSGKLDAASSDLDEAEELLRGEAELIDAQELRVVVRSLLGPIASLADAIEPAVDAIRADHPARAAMLLVAGVSPLCMAGAVQRASEMAHDALDLTDGLPPEVTAPARLAVLSTSALQGKTEETRRMLSDLVQSLSTSSPPSGDALPPEAVASIAAPLMWLGDLDEARTMLVHAVHRAREASALGILPLPLGFLAEVDLRRGDWLSAIALADEAVDLGTSIGAAATTPYPTLTTTAMVAACRGERERCNDLVEGALELSRQTGAVSFEAFGLAATTMLAMTDGDWRMAAEQMRLLDDAVRGSGVAMPSAVPVLLSRAEALHRSGAEAEAARHAEMLSEEADRTEIPLVLGVAARTRALCGTDDREAHLAEANRWHAVAGDRFEQARTWLITGELLRRARRNVEAREPLNAAHATFRRLQASPWAERAMSELRASGGSDPRVRAADDVSALTARELRVAMAVAEGGTNREVATTLFISPKTVEYHLAKVFRKLGVKSRTELATLLARVSASGDDPVPDS